MGGLKKYLSLTAMVLSVMIFLLACEVNKSYKIECVEVVGKDSSGGFNPTLELNVNNVPLKITVKNSHIKSIEVGQIINVEYNKHFVATDLEIALECKSQ